MFFEFNLHNFMLFLTLAVRERDGDNTTDAGERGAHRTQSDNLFDV
jgi:hypothetical protein